MTKFVFQGSGHTTGGDGIKAAACIGALLLLGGGTAGAFAAHLSAAITDLLYWIAGVLGTAAAAGIAVLAWRLRGRPERNARTAAALAERQRSREAEIDERAARRAVTAARAQADAWSPLIAAVAAGMQPQAWPQRQAASVIIIPSEAEELPR